MPSLKSHARWGEALRSTLALWLFVLFIFLPVIVRRHAGEPWTGTAIDCSTIIVSIGFAMLMFLASRATIDWPPMLRLPLRALAVLVAAGANTVFDLMFQGWIANHFVEAWRTLPADFTRAYSSMLNYILVFGVNMILFHVNYARRAAIQPWKMRSNKVFAPAAASTASARSGRRSIGGQSIVAREARNMIIARPIETMIVEQSIATPVHGSPAWRRTITGRKMNRTNSQSASVERSASPQRA